MDYKVEIMKPSDWKQVSEIYTDGINTKVATFQSEVPSWEEWDKGHCDTCRLVARNDDDILGWAALSPVSGRCVYTSLCFIISWEKIK